MEPAIERAGERRRTCRRRTAEEHGIVGARVRPGYDAVVIDISADGALVETVHRLLPGTCVDLLLDIVEERIAVRGQVLRCSVAAVLPWSIVYRGAILFECSLAWLRDGNAVPAAPEDRWGVATRTDR
jgi:hypothetical protein